MLRPRAPAVPSRASSALTTSTCPIAGSYSALMHFAVTLTPLPPARIFAFFAKIIDYGS